MGWAAARKLRRTVANAIRVVAIEAMTAARAIELRRPRRPAPATAAVIEGLRQTIPGIGTDRYLAPEIDHAAGLARSGKIVAWAESETGALQ